jgi:hypothetical protein
MSNRVGIIRTEFKDMTTGIVSYGFRMYDDYEGVYSNLYEESIKDLSDMELLREASELCSVKDSDMLVAVAENEDGVEIDGTYYEWDEIKSILGQRRTNYEQ